MLHSFIEKFWYRSHPVRWVFYPFSLIYQTVSALRRFYLKRFRQAPIPVPLIVVGNLTVGGVGKTPLVIALANALTARGLRVGIVSRGYGSRSRIYPREVMLDDLVDEVGDEPLLIAQKTHCPVVIAPKRTEAVQELLNRYQCQIILSDDGLQHYAMPRTMEIVVLDGTRGLGNGLCIPAGPLRESAARLKSVDFVIVNGGDQKNAYRMDLIPGVITQLTTGKKRISSEFTAPVAAVAGIGNPQRFYNTLHELCIPYQPHSFPDHHHFQPNELAVFKETVVMTEKDGVKCRSFATDNLHVLPVEAKLSKQFWEAFWKHERLQDYL